MIASKPPRFTIVIWIAKPRQYQIHPDAPAPPADGSGNANRLVALTVLLIPVAGIAGGCDAVGRVLSWPHTMPAARLRTWGARMPDRPAPGRAAVGSGPFLSEAS